MIRCTSCWPSPPSGPSCSTPPPAHHLDPRWLLLEQSGRDPLGNAVPRDPAGRAGPHPDRLRLAIGILWIVLVPCEMLGVSAGMGYFILDTRDRLAYPELMAMVLLIGLLGFLLDAAARALYRRWSR